MKKTGRTETILGIQADETEGLLTVEGPAIPGMAQSGPSMKMVMHIWTARPEEVLRSQALREFSGYTQYSALFLNTADMVKKMMGRMPGFGGGFESMFREIQQSNTAVLRIRMEIRMPMMALIAQQMAKAGQPFPAGFDPDAPLMQMNQELVELSSTPVDDGVFAVPQGFHEAPFEDLVKTAIPPAAKQ